MLKILKVQGQSMSPLYNDGDFLLLKKTALKRLTPNDQVVFNHPKYGIMVKSVLDINQAEQTLKVKGIHSSSMSSQKIGAIQIEWLLGKTIFHIKKKKS